MTRWDFQNKGTLTSPARRSFVFKVPLRHLRPSIIYSVPCDWILQRPLSCNEECDINYGYIVRLIGFFCPITISWNKFREDELHFRPVARLCVQGNLSGVESRIYQGEEGVVSTLGFQNQWGLPTKCCKNCKHFTHNTFRHRCLRFSPFVGHSFSKQLYIFLS